MVDATFTYPYPVPFTNPACDDIKHDEEPSKCTLASKCVEDCAAYGKVCPCAAKSAAQAACKAIKKLRENSSIFTSDDVDFRRLNSDDLEIGEKLGEGGFNTVRACTLKSDPTKKLAIKYLKRKAMVNQRQFEHGAADLAQESYFLSVLDHKHIIKLHGVTAGSVDTNVASGKKCGFFITLDRLHETLEQRLAKWKKECRKQQTGVLTRMTQEYREKKKEELRERIQIALEIADALEYLHNKNIIFRDLKPDNIAFDDDGVLKLFDFGLAKELKPGQADVDGRYQLTGNTGSRRYMAPEVAKDQPYNKSVDVYSFGILMHELLSGEKPFYGYSSNKHMSQVVMGGERPKMDSRTTAFWPRNLKWLIKRCWSPFPTFRPDFALIKQTLQDALDGKEVIPDLRPHPEPSESENQREYSPGAFPLLKPKRMDRGQQAHGCHDSFSSSCGSSPVAHGAEEGISRRGIPGIPWCWTFRK